MVRDARRCRAPHHEGRGRPHPDPRLRGVSKDAATALNSLSREGWGAGAAANAIVEWIELPPTRCALRAQRPPPQAGEVKPIRGQTESTKNYPALAQQL